MSTRVDVHVVRVFCDDDGAFGNELGIVVSSDASRGHEQRIARELGFSETVFVDEVGGGGLDAGAGSGDGPAAGSGAVAHVRIFTPAMELGFAGHPSVGTAWWLASTGRAVSILRERAGDVTVRTDANDASLVFVGAHASWAPAFDWHELGSVAEVDALDPAAVSNEHDYYYAWLDESAASLRSRMFATTMGIAEDEATGAAAVALTGRLEKGLRIRQGLGSRISTSYLGEGLVEVGGRTVFDRSFAFDLG